MLPDIRADYSETERSSYLERLSLWHLQCALSENCLPDSVFKIIERKPSNSNKIDLTKHITLIIKII